MRRLLILLFGLMLASCAGYMADHLRSKSDLIAPQLIRYGISGTEGQCVEQKLTAALTTWQLRQLADLADRLEPGGTNPASFGPREFVYVAGLVEDEEVAPKTRSALQDCNIAFAAAAPASAAVARGPDTPAEPAVTAAPTPPRSAPASEEDLPLWVNLGAASTGQGIAVDARSVTREQGARRAWFRLLRVDGQTIVGETGYLLRIDCTARTITAFAGRAYAPDGALVEQKDYAEPEGPLAIEGGTVIEVAYHALCDDPR